MVDTEGYKQIMKYANKTKIAVEKEEWKLATQLWSATESVILNMTGNIDFYNILYKSRGRNYLKSIIYSNKVEGKEIMKIEYQKDML